MPRIIAYTYCADVHCPDCADAAYAAGWLVRSGRHGEYDEHGLPMSLIDSEGNPARPVFSTDERHTDHCSDCGALVYDDFADIKPPKVPQGAKRIHDPWGLLNLG